MEIPLQVTFRGVSRSEALQARIRDSVAKLEQIHPRLISCRVTVEQGPRHSRHGHQFGVGIDVRGPGHEEVVSTLHRHEDVYVALRDAFDAVGRQLDDAATHQRRTS